MTANAIEQDFQKKMTDRLRLVPEGVDRYRVFTPFLFEDGDHLAIVLKKVGRNWFLTDEGHTYMHLTYELDEKDLQRGTRQKILSNALSAFSVNDQEGELVMEIADDRYGDALYSFVQALLKVSDVTFLSRERVRSTFMEDFRAFIEEKAPKGRFEFDWRDPEHDPEGKYIVDCRVNGMAKPMYLFALPGDDKVRDATIAILQFERWKTPFRSVAVFEDQEEVNRKVLARFSDVCEKQFSSLAANRDRIERFLKEALQVQT